MTTATTHQGADTMGITGQTERYEVINWLGETSLYASEAERDEIASAILASGSTDEAEWLAIVEQHTA